jgi:hypothetical protein
MALRPDGNRKNAIIHIESPLQIEDCRVPIDGLMIGDWD